MEGKGEFVCYGEGQGVQELLGFALSFNHG